MQENWTGCGCRVIFFPFCVSKRLFFSLDFGQVFIGGCYVWNTGLRAGEPEMHAAWPLLMSSWHSPGWARADLCEKAGGLMELL